MAHTCDFAHVVNRHYSVTVLVKRCSGDAFCQGLKINASEECKGDFRDYEYFYGPVELQCPSMVWKMPKES